MSKEKVLNEKLVEASLTLSQNEYKIMLSAMQEHADQEKEKAAVAFGNWLKETILDGDVPDLYKYFITNVYNK